MLAKLKFPLFYSVRNILAKKSNFLETEITEWTTAKSFIKAHRHLRELLIAASDSLTKEIIHAFKTYVLKAKNRNNRKRCQTCSKLTTKTPD